MPIAHHFKERTRVFRAFAMPPDYMGVADWASVGPAPLARPRATKRAVRRRYRGCILQYHTSQAYVRWPGSSDGMAYRMSNQTAEQRHSARVNALGAPPQSSLGCAGPPPPAAKSAAPAAGAYTGFV